MQLANARNDGGCVAARLAAVAIRPPAAEPSVSGLWQKTDEETGKSGRLVSVLRARRHYEGVIAKLFPRPGDAQIRSVRVARTTARMQPLLGIPLIRGMKRNGLVYRAGNILDPRDGNIYSAMMTVSPDGRTLTVRGFLGIALFGRDEVWHRLPDTALKELDPIIVAKYLPDDVKATTDMRLRHPENTANRRTRPLRLMTRSGADVVIYSTTPNSQPGAAY